MNVVSRMRTRAAEGTRSMMLSLGLLLLRVSVGGMMAYGHGWGKVQMLFGGKAGEFADPLNLGKTLSLGLATFAEFLCSLLVIVGLATRLATIPLVATMGVAAVIVHRADDFATREKALLYLAAFAALLLTGAGRFSLDAVLGRRKQRPQ